MAREHANKSAAAKRQVREGLVAAVATMIRAGEAVTAATAGPRTAIRNLLSRARTRAAGIAKQARPRRAREVAARGGARKGQAIAAPAGTSSRDITRPRKRSKSHGQRKASRRGPASPSRRGRRR